MRVEDLPEKNGMGAEGLSEKNGMGFAHLPGLGLSAEQLQAFALYRSRLLQENEQVNLTAITDPEEIEIKHFWDSLLLRQSSLWTGEGRAADVGSGAGFPGLPLRLVSPGLALDMFEASGKKVRFLERLIDELGLAGVRAFHLRAEEAGRAPELRERYDWVFARALAAMPVLLEYCLPLLRRGGLLAAYKGPGGGTDAAEAKKAAALLGGKLIDVYEAALPLGKGERSIVIYRKVAATPGAYPRRPGLPGKQPLR
jgi:16S rRNA (guanine527-N7)-methyltransferase